MNTTEWKKHSIWRQISKGTNSRLKHVLEYMREDNSRIIVARHKLSDSMILGTDRKTQELIYKACSTMIKVKFIESLDEAVKAHDDYIDTIQK